jgi:hypothetical protein
MATTLEILAPYLPYGIACEYPLAGNPYGETMRRTLVGLNSETGVASLSNETTIWAGACKPVLRPFNQLCTPLEDGTVPAELLFEIAFEHNYTAGLPIGVPNPEYAECAFTAQIMAGGMLSVKRFGFGDCELRIYSDWQFARSVDGILRWAHHPSAMVDKLRGWHFALPVNGRPLVEGVDYIAKGVSAPTIEKGTAQQASN